MQSNIKNEDDLTDNWQPMFFCLNQSCNRDKNNKLRKFEIEDNLWFAEIRLVWTYKANNNWIRSNLIASVKLCSLVYSTQLIESDLTL